MSEEKVDLKKPLKELYTASSKNCSFIEVPEYLYLMIDGKGDPNDECYHESIETLFSAAYTLKFMSKKLGKDFVVMPLEGLWWADRMQDFIENKRTNWIWTQIIMQPKWITCGMFEEAIRALSEKNGPKRYRELRLESWKEGTCAQILHLGPYSEEPLTIDRLHEAIREKGNFDGQTHKHHEFYLSDPRKTAPEKLKTIIRQPYVPI